MAIYLNYTPELVTKFDILFYHSNHVIYKIAYVRIDSELDLDCACELSGSETDKKSFSDQSCLACFNTLTKLNCGDLEALLVQSCCTYLIYSAFLKFHNNMLFAFILKTWLQPVYKIEICSF